MKNMKISAIALAIGFVFSTGGMAEIMTKSQYQSQEKGIEADYKVDQEACNSFSSNAKDICLAEAKGKENIAKSELQVSFKPSTKSRYQASVTKAEADYAVAIERCDDKAGNEKDVCVKEAKSAKIHHIADAKTQMKSKQANAEARETASDAQTEANEKSDDANMKASKTKAEVRTNGRMEKRDADYAVAKEKCDALAGSVKDHCVADAKSRFGQ